MSLTFQLEPVSACWDEVLTLAEQHWAGTKSYRRHEPFLPSKARYQSCNESGFFRLVTAREGPRLVGYFGVYVSPSMHSQLLMATEDTFYLHPDYRAGRTALRFLKHIELLCQHWGVHEVLFSCEQDNTSGIKGLLSLLGYEPVIQQYRKLLTPTPEEATHVRTIATARA